MHIFSIFNKITFTVLFFIITPLVIGTVFVYLTLTNSNSLQNESRPINNKVLSYETTGTQIFASVPSSYPSITGNILAGDARGEIIKLYLEKYQSPLVPYAHLIVNTADKYKVDFRLLTAISQQESNLCKNYPEGTYNCYGWGIHSRGTLGFSSFEEGIETVTKGLKTEYIDKGYTNPEEIMAKYTPSSNGSWAEGVNKFISEMQ